MLYNLAYAGATSEGPQAERMGQSLLTNQFITGLQPHLKRRLIGVEGSFEEIVLKSRFEEARRGEFAAEKPKAPTRDRTTRFSNGQQLTSDPPVTTSSAPPVGKIPNSGSRGGPRVTSGNCYNCGMEGHMAKNCTYPKRSRRGE